jgi:hypothetical protein
MNLIQRLNLVSGRQIAVAEGLELLHQARRELSSARSSADTWALWAVMSSAILVPANCIINAFELKAAASLYQVLARTAYAQFAASGTRQSGPVKTVLAALKKAIVEDLKRKGMAQFVPGVNILVGLAEDSAALADVVRRVEQGGREMRSLTADLDRKIAAAHAQLSALGIERAALMERAEHFGRTA